MKIRWSALIPCLLIPLALGGLASLVTGGGMDLFDDIHKPAATPPAWVFPVVWTILYLLMGLACYRVWLTGPGRPRKRALITYGVQLAMNFVWTLLFFNGDAFGPAFIWLVLLWLAILTCAILFDRLDRPAAAMLLLYLAWVGYAGYLNGAIWYLNP